MTRWATVPLPPKRLETPVHPTVSFDVLAVCLPYGEQPDWF